MGTTTAPLRNGMEWNERRKGPSKTQKLLQPSYMECPSPKTEKRVTACLLLLLLL